MRLSETSASVDRGVVVKSVNGVPLRVLKSACGFYIGTWDDSQGPLSRESTEYWPKEADANLALDTGQWTQFSYDPL